MPDSSIRKPHSTTVVYNLRRIKSLLLMTVRDHLAYSAQRYSPILVATIPINIAAGIRFNV
jgi:hypothetical protein